MRWMETSRLATTPRRGQCGRRKTHDSRGWYRGRGAVATCLLLLPSVALAGLPPKDNDGGFKLNAWFSPNAYDELGLDASHESEYCDLFQETSDRMWVATEGQHYVKHVTFMVGELESGIRLYPGSGRATAAFGGRVNFPHDLPLNVPTDSKIMNHEFGHHIYGLPDEYLEVAISGLGYCVDETSTDFMYNACTSVPMSTCLSGAGCAVVNGCLGGTHNGKICDYDQVGIPPNDFLVEAADCAAGGGTCLEAGPGVCLVGDDIGDPCNEHSDCVGAPAACSKQLVDKTFAVDVPIGEDSCLMAAQSPNARWCHSGNHQHEIQPFVGLANPLSLDQQKGIQAYAQDGLFAQASDYNCWDAAMHHYADLDWGGAYSSLSDLGSPPPTTCEWAIDDLDLTGSTALVVDTSGSMTINDAWRSAADGAEYFYDKIYQNAPGSNAGLYQFDATFQPLPTVSGTPLVVDAVQDLGDGIDRDVLEGHMNPHRKTHICDALTGAADEFAGFSATGRKIVLLTDGRDTSPEADACDPVALAEDLCEAGVSVHALAYGAANVGMTRKMTNAGCGSMKYAPRGGVGRSNVLALQMGFARISASVEGDAELLYKRQVVRVGMAGDLVEEVLVVPKEATAAMFTWMGSAEPWLGTPLFNMATYTVTSPSGDIYLVGGGVTEDRARFRSLEVLDPEPGEWVMTTDAVISGITAQPAFELGALATVASPYEPFAWTLHETGALHKPMRVRALVDLDREPMTRVKVSAEIVNEDLRWPIPLYDDGMHGDDERGDGVYGGTFAPTEIGPHNVEVTFDVQAGVSHTVYSHVQATDTFTLRADTAFEVLPNEPRVGGTVNHVPPLPDMHQAGTYTGLYTIVSGAPLSAADTVLSLGPGVDISNLTLSCASCRVNDSQTYELWFDAAVNGDAPLGMRDLVVQSGARQYRLQDATEVLPTIPRAFGPGDLVVSEIMALPVELGTWFEIYNPSSDQVDLYGLEIDDGARDAFQIEHSVAVPGRGYAVLASGDAAAVGFEADYVYEGMALEREDALFLVSDRATVDAVAWDERFPMSSGASMSLSARSLTARDNDEPSSWCPGNERYASDSMGTPGRANPSCSSIGFGGGRH